MKPALLFFGLALAAAASAAFAQTSVRAPADVSGVRTGVPCDAASGLAVSTDASGNIVCTNRVTSAGAADTATNALNAVNATTLTGTLNASQISGALSANQVQSALPTCTSGQVLTNINGTASCVTAASGGGGGITCVGGNISSTLSGTFHGSNFSFTVSAAVASMNAAGTVNRTLSGKYGSWHHMLPEANASCAIVATCNSNGSWSFTQCVATYTNYMIGDGGAIADSSGPFYGNVTGPN